MKGRFTAIAAIAAITAAYTSAQTHSAAPAGIEFLGTYQASCQGTAEGGLKGQWQWNLEVSHRNEDDEADPQALSVFWSTTHQERIWLVSFEHMGQGAFPTYEGAGDEDCNITTYTSKIADGGITGTIESGQYPDPGCKPNPTSAPIYHAAWKSELQMGVGESTIGTFHLAYQGYDKVQDPSYEFTCQLMKSSPAANMLAVSSDTINVSVHTQLWTEDNDVPAGTLEQLAPKWEKIAPSYWNNQNILVDGKKVRFDFHFAVAGTKDKLTSEYHHIEVINGAPNSIGTYCAYVIRDDNPFGPNEGTFPMQILDPTLGHEVGHLMGLADEYDDFQNKSDIPASIALNGQTLFPTYVNELPQFGVWDVAYGLQGQTQGIMSQKTPEIKAYYLDLILKALGYTHTQ